ncbi:hypothetical protein B484DRAFT_440601 [Ochromonadaceae sp. CCMP2298]|nr:hypothetical protein B484DRAFT_440601 [Ochromonadaceae sp. CCMP2298]
MVDRRTTLRGPQGPFIKYAPVEIPTAVAREAKRDEVYENSLLKGTWHTLPRPFWTRGPLGTPILELRRVWRREDVYRMPRSDYVTAGERAEIGRGLGMTSVIMPGERLGMFAGDFSLRAKFDSSPSRFGLTLDDHSVLDCYKCSMYYCIPSHCNDFRNLVHRDIGAAGVVNCELVRGDGDDIWLVATRMMIPGPEGFIEALTDYGEECDPVHML